MRQADVISHHNDRKTWLGILDRGSHCKLLADDTVIQNYGIDGVGCEKPQGRTLARGCQHYISVLLQERPPASELRRS